MTMEEQSKSPMEGPKISDAQYQSNFQSISSVMNNVDERDQKESQKVSGFSQHEEDTPMQSPGDIP
jgi:hypothetical protein